MTKEKDVIALSEEQVAIVKHRIEGDRVRVSIRVDEVDKLLSGSLTSEFVDVERVPADELVDVPPVTIEEPHRTVIAVVHEEFVLQRRFRIVERIIVHRKSITEQVSLPARARIEIATVERLAPPDGVEVPAQPVASSTPTNERQEKA